MAFTLYHNDVSVCAQKVRMTLAEKGLDWEDNHLSLRDGDHLAPEYLKLNPNGVVPTLVHDGRVVIESTVINEYLDSVVPKNPLRPGDMYDRARMRIWTKQVDDTLHSAVGILSFCIALRWSYLERSDEENDTHINRIPSRARRASRRRTVEQGTDAPEFEDAILRYRKLLADMDEALAHHPWLLGDEISLADIALTPYLTRLDVLSLGGMFEPHANVMDWFDRIRARNSYDTAFTRWLNPYYQEMMQKRGQDAWPRVQEILAADAAASARTNMKGASDDVPAR